MSHVDTDAATETDNGTAPAGSRQRRGRIWSIDALRVLG